MIDIYKAGKEQEETINKKSVSIALSCYILWGILPAYWNLLSGLNPIFILCYRIVFAFAFTIGILAVSGRMQVFKDTLKDKAAMRRLVPSSLLITCNWGAFIWAVNSGRILESSLGYYMTPLIAFVLGVIIFREKFRKLQIAAVILAFAGVLVSSIAFGSFPFVSIGLALSFAIYGVLKKKAHVDPVAGIALESLLFAPIALIISLVFMSDEISAAGATGLLLLVAGGVVTALPLIMYSRAVNDLPLNIVGFLQYISPSLAMTYGLFTGETATEAQIICFIFIGIGLIVFSVALIPSRTRDQSDNRSDNQSDNQSINQRDTS